MLLNELAERIFSSISVRKHTLETYRSMYRCHVAQAIGEMDIADINRSDIKQLLIGIPPQTAAMTLAVIKVLFREALEYEWLEKSPV